MSSKTHEKYVQNTTEEQKLRSVTIDAIDTADVAYNGFDMLRGILAALAKEKGTPTSAQLIKAGEALAFDHACLLESNLNRLQALAGGES